ncbi:MAG TPA: class I SAM-dependent methyltransferase [Armatimonadota bacterium]|nr:class I SAM-dependent methyltransferase [Armatimonadota bacterium]
MPPVYMDNGFTHNTRHEIDFLLDVCQLQPGNRILEIGCGTGRHSVELAKRGYRVTAVDISEGMLAEAAQAADAAGVDIDFIHADARHYQPDPVAYDAAICLCEGAFCLLGQDDDAVGSDIAILRNVAAGLKNGAPFMLTVLNAYRRIRSVTPEEISSGSYDPMTLVELYDMEWYTPDGPRSVRVRERSYTPTEMVLYCRLAGLAVENIWGGTAGNWGQRPLDLDEIEMMVIARKVNA